MRSIMFGLFIAISPILCFAKDRFASNALSSSELFFIENKGQITDQYHNQRGDIDYKIGSGGMNVFLGNGQIHYQFSAVKNREALGKVSDIMKAGGKMPSSSDLNIEMYRMDVTLLGANTKAVAIEEDEQAYFENYYLPGIGEQGATAHAYKKITYKDVYPHIDWVFYSKEGKMKYEFVVRPGGNPSDIRLKFEGATGLSLDNGGSLTAVTPLGTIKEDAPYSYEAGPNKTVASSFQLKNNVLSFNTASHEGTLVIDPTIVWTLLYGGPDGDYSGGLATDAAGNIFISGYTLSLGFISTVGAYQTFNNGGSIGLDAFLFKVNTTGQIVWATYYGGSGDDYGFRVACDATGDVYLTGATYSTGTLASTGVYQGFNNGSLEGFVAKFSSSTGLRSWGTFVGGFADDGAFTIAVDASGVYVGGRTASSSSIATAGAHQQFLNGTEDAFVMKLNTTGSSKLWGTYYGGTGNDGGTNIALDGSGNPHFVGWTYSTSGIASAGAHQLSLGGVFDAFVVKFNSSGARQWGTYYGGTSDDQATSVAIDASLNVFMGGYSASTNGIASVGAYQAAFGGGLEDGLLVKFNSAGVRQWGTYFGGNDYDEIDALALDASGSVYLCGYTASISGLPTSGGVQTTYAGGSDDGLLGKFTTTGGLVWGSYFGGLASEELEHIKIDPAGNIHAAGQTNSVFATNGGVADIFFTKITDCSLPAQPGTITGSATICTGSGNQTYSVAAVTGATSYTWTLPGGWTGTSTTNTITVTPGSSGGTISVTANNSCGSSAAQTLSVTVTTISATITPSGPTTFCSGGSVILNANTGAGLTYQWNQNSVPLPGATASSYTVTASGTYTVAVSAGVNCNATSSPVTVTVNPSPTATITPAGPTSFCSGGSVVLNANTGAGLTYQWQLNNVNINGAVSSSYTATTSGSYTVIVTNAGNCSTTSSAVTVTVNTAPPATITPAGPTTFCSGGNVLLNANTGIGLTYQWQLNSVNITGANGTGYTATASGNYTVIVTSGGCSTTSSVVSVTVTPGPANLLAGSNSPVCVGGNINLTASSTTTGVGYSWQGPGGYNSNVQNPTITSATLAHAGTYAVTATVNGCSSSATTTVVVTSGIPAQPGTITGSATVCDGSSQVYSIASVTGATSYTWTFPAGWSGSSTTNTINVTAGPTGGVISVIAVNGCGTSAAQTLNVTVTPAPAATVTPAGPTTFCSGGNVVLNANTGGSLTYQWQLNGSNISGAASASHTATASGAYTVIVTDGACSATSSAVNVTVHPLPTPSLTISGFTMTTSATFNSYQWYLGGNPITGGTNQSYTATQNGTYHVVVTDANGCTGQSNSITVNNVGIASIPSGMFDVALYPNPNKGVFTVEGTIKTNRGKVALEIVDLTGRIIMKAEAAVTGNKLTKQLRMNEYAAGFYMLRIKADNEQCVLSFIKE